MTLRTGGLLDLAGLKVLLGCLSAKGGVGSPGIVTVLEGIDERVELVEAVGQVVDGPH
jgi:hypothetical protein